MPRKRKPWATALLLFACAFALRAPFAHNYLPYMFHVDEQFIANGALHMMKTGDLKPTFYNYGSLMIYLNLGVDVLHYFHLMGQPASSDSYMESLDELETGIDSGWRWTFSHPSFLFWNRLLTVLFGSACVSVCFLLARRILQDDKLAGFAALLLTLSPFTSQNSAYITPDIPVVLFVLTTVYFALLFAETQGVWWLVWSASTAGLAVATKYNSAPILIAPAVAIAWSQYRAPTKVKPYYWTLVLGLPPLAFFIAMPYALLDLPSFLRGSGAELRHYKVLGHPNGYMSEPGFDHLMYQIGNFREDLGTLALILACIGLATALKNKRLLFALCAPTLLLCFMINMRVNFHRNFCRFIPS